MNSQQTIKVANALRDLAAGCSKIASLHAEQKKASESSKQASAPTEATVQLAKTVASKIAGIYEIRGATEESVARQLLSGAGALDVFNKVLDSIQSDRAKIAATPAGNPMGSGLGQAADPVQPVNSDRPSRSSKPVFRQNRR